MAHRARYMVRSMDQVRRRRTQQERRAESEQRLLAATAELIVERGFAQLSLSAIGERAGCSHALVTHLFGTKAALLEQLNGIVDDLYVTQIEPALAGQAGPDSVAAFVRAYLGLVTSGDPMARVQVVLWAQAFAATPELRASRVEWDRHFRTGVAELVSRALGKPGIDTESETTAFVIVGLLRGVAMQQLVDPTSVSVPASVDRVVDAVRGLLAS
jgi:AcrR family transcriptional regulator